MDAWSFYGSLGGQDRSTLTKVEAEVAAICDLRQEVNAGGFDSYFRHWGGNTAQEALAALPMVLGRDWADLLRTAMSVLGSDYPVDPNVRQDRLASPGVVDALHDLDTAYFELELSTDADTLVAAHLAGSPP